VTRNITVKFLEVWNKFNKLWRKSKLNSEKIWKIQKKSKLNSEMIWKIQKDIASYEDRSDTESL